MILKEGSIFLVVCLCLNLKGTLSKKFLNYIFNINIISHFKVYPLILALVLTPGMKIFTMQV